MLNDPEFAKNVKGLERMLRVRDSACLGFAGFGSSGRRVVAGREKDTVITVSELQRYVSSGGCPSTKAGERGEFGLLEVVKSDFSVCHRMLVARALLCLLLVHLLLARTALALHLLLLLFRCACMVVTHVHVLIRVRTRLVHRVPREGGVPKVGFPVRPKICALSQRWRQG